MSSGGPILLFGGTGLLGEALRVELGARGREVLAPEHATLDLEDEHEVATWLDRETVSAVVNAAAYTDVARAELAEEHEAVFRLNRDAPAALARACRERELPLVFISTDFVFDGRLGRPYHEADDPAPLQVYGRSKLEGERAVARAHPPALIVRTSTLFGPGRRERPHYVDAIIEQAATGDRIRVVRTPVASPTYTPDLAWAVTELLELGVHGVVHVVNAGECSRLELAREVIRLTGGAQRVTVEERPEADDGARRPAYSVLDASHFARLTGKATRPWRRALAEYVARRAR